MDNSCQHRLLPSCRVKWRNGGDSAWALYRAGDCIRGVVPHPCALRRILVLLLSLEVSAFTERRGASSSAAVLLHLGKGSQRSFQKVLFLSTSYMLGLCFRTISSLQQSFTFIIRLCWTLVFRPRREALPRILCTLALVCGHVTNDIRSKDHEETQNFIIKNKY